MVRRPRALLLIAVLLAALLAACGVSGGDDTASRVDPTTVTTPEGPTGSSGAPDGVTDQLADGYRQFGFTDEEAECLADAFGPLASGANPLESPELLDGINQCDIPPSRLFEILGNVAGGTFDDTFESSIVSAFEAGGLTKDEAECMASGFIDDYGIDTTKMADPDSLRHLFEQCDVDPSSFGG